MIPIHILPDKRGNGNLLFNEFPPFFSEYLSMEFCTYSLKGRELFRDQKMKQSKSNLFAIHGAKSNYNSLNPILYPLQTLDIPSVCFNLSGHSITSTNAFESISLQQNLEESLYFVKSLNVNVRNILGFSFGGALALKVAEVHKLNVERIVLIALALYTEKSNSSLF